MYNIEVPKIINFIMKSFHRFGFWNRGDVATVIEMRIKFFYSIYYLVFVTSAIVGAYKSENNDETIWMTQFSVVVLLLFAKLLFIIWKKNDIVDLVHRIGQYSVHGCDQQTLINGKLKSFDKFLTPCCYVTGLIIFCAAFVVPFLGNEKRLLYNIAFPLDWKSSEFGFWIAFAFLTSVMFVSTFALLFTILMWYLMFACGLRFKALGTQIKTMGVITKTIKQRNISEFERENLFRRDFVGVIETHKLTAESTSQMNSFLSVIFILQFTTSGLGITFSTYCLAFYSSENMIEYMLYAFTLVYNITDIFMIMYFGNEINWQTDRLSYCLFESDWISLAPSTKKNVVIFGELLQESYEMLILKVFPLNLSTFTRILKSAYSMFNILQNLK